MKQLGEIRVLGIVFDDQEELRCAIHAFEEYSEKRRVGKTPTSRIDGILKIARELLTPESVKLEEERTARKKLEAFERDRSYDEAQARDDAELAELGFERDICKP